MNNKNNYPIPLYIPVEWKRFLSGKWQKEMPTKPGTYPIADRLGNHAGYNTVVLNKGIPQSVQQWEGWWWSAPQPYLPRPFKPWNEHENT